MARLSLFDGEKIMKKLAIIGTGMSGMSAAHFLQNDYDITIFEKASYVGGHTNTVYVEEEGERKPIDTGFMVFNNVTYPQMIKLFAELDVPTYNTDMSFSVNDVNIDLEFNGSSLKGLFSQKKNLFSPSYIRMLLDVSKLSKMSAEILTHPRFEHMPVKDLVEKEGFSKRFLDHFLLPMSSAVWSTPNEKIMNFHLRTLIQFFVNHGFLGLDTQHQWKTVQGGSQTYKLKIIEPFKNRIRLNSGAVQVKSLNGKVLVTIANGESQEFDKVVIASHADEALEMLEAPNMIQKELLSPFKYQENIALLHTDESVMPKIKGNWSSWNFAYREDEIFTIYYMNRLQNISKKTNYFVNINGERFIDKNKVLKRIVYHHPVFDTETAKAQLRLQELNTGKDNIYFTGSYFRYGFHEDALLSSVILCESMLKRKVLK